MVTIEVVFTEESVVGAGDEDEDCGEEAEEVGHEKTRKSDLPISIQLFSPSLESQHDVYRRNIGPVV